MLLIEHIMADWHGGNTAGHINKVTLHQARLVLGWVTIYGPINHLSM